MAVPILQKKCWIKITAILSCKTDFIEFQSIVDGSQFAMHFRNVYFNMMCAYYSYIHTNYNGQLQKEIHHVGPQ